MTSTPTLDQKALDSAVEGMIDAMDAENRRKGLFSGYAPRESYRPSLRPIAAAAIEKYLAAVNRDAERGQS